MITFKEFLSEQEVENIVTLLKHDCGPFLRESKNGYLKRGVQGLKEPATVQDIDGGPLHYYYKEIRSNRKPLSTPDHTHAAIDAWFKKKFGFKARSNAMFAVGSKSTMSKTSGYGTTCIVFPIGEIQYVWSPDMGDLWVYLPEKFTAEGSEHHNYTDEIEAWLDEQNYQDTELDAACKDNVEVMVQADAYYAFPIIYHEQIFKALDSL